MRRVALILAVVGLFSFSADRAFAHGPHQGHGAYNAGRYYHPYHHRSIVVHPPLVVAPRVVAPVPLYPPMIYRPRCIDLNPSYGFYYQGRGLSIGVGF